MMCCNGRIIRRVARRNKYRSLVIAGGFIIYHSLYLLYFTTFSAVPYLNSGDDLALLKKNVSLLIQLRGSPNSSLDSGENQDVELMDLVKAHGHNDISNETVQDFDLKNITVNLSQQDLITRKGFVRLKIELLQARIRDVLKKWDESVLSTRRQKPRDLCTRYDAEAAEVKVHVTNVWHEANTIDDRLLTLVTQMSEGKLGVLERLLHHWSGPMSLALYLDNSTLPQLPNILLQRNSSMLYRTNVDIHLVIKSGEFYPVNFLRNIALNNTDYKYVFLTDVDFMPSYDSYQYIHKHLTTPHLNDNQVFVVPAFEFPSAKNVTEFPKDKKELLQIWTTKNIMPFHWKFYPGHGPTGYKKWKKAHSPYSVKYRNAYEPYIVIKRQGAPPYDQGFVGRLGNKIQHLLHVHSVGFQFVVLPGAFLIHYPHKVNWHVRYFSCSVRKMDAFKADMKRRYPKNKKT